MLKILEGSIVTGKSGKSLKVISVDGEKVVVKFGDDLLRVNRSAILRVISSPPQPKQSKKGRWLVEWEQEMIEYATLCLTNPEVSDAEAIDNILNWRDALADYDFASLFQALPPDLQGKVRDLQAAHDRGQIPTGATVFGATGSGATVIGRIDAATLAIQSPDGRRGKVSISKVLKWRYPLTDREFTSSHDNN